MSREYDYAIYTNVAGVVSPTGQTITASPLVARERRFAQYPDRSTHQLTRFGDDAGYVMFLGGDIRSLAPDCQIYIPGTGYVTVAEGVRCGLTDVIEAFRRAVRLEWCLFNWPDVTALRFF